VGHGLPPKLIYIFYFFYSHTHFLILSDIGDIRQINDPTNLPAFGS